MTPPGLHNSDEALYELVEEIRAAGIEFPRRLGPRAGDARAQPAAPLVIEVVETGLVYRNPRPELRSLHAWHPSLVRFDDGELVCVFDRASADQALDYRAFVTRSTDGGGRGRSPPGSGRLGRPARRPTSCARAGCATARSSASAGGCSATTRTSASSTCPASATREMDLFLIRSSDRGRTWSPPSRSSRRSSGPSWELCHAIVELRDGRWLLPLSTWMGWHGEAPNGMFATGLRLAGPGPDLARVPPRVRSLGRGRDPLGAVAGRAAGRPAAGRGVEPRLEDRRRRARRRTPSRRRRRAVHGPRPDRVARPDHAS